MNVGDKVRFKSSQTNRYYERYAGMSGTVAKREVLPHYYKGDDMITVVLDTGCVDCFSWRLEQVNPCPMKEV